MLLVLIGVSAGSSLVLAEEPQQGTDPIQINDDHWAPANGEADLTKSTAKPATVPAKPAENAKNDSSSTVAAPSRPINIPVMPTVVRSYTVQVDSTAEAVTPSTAEVVTKEDGEPDIALQEQNWRDATEMAREHADDQRNVNSDGERVALSVRLSYRPNPKIAPKEQPGRPLRARISEIPTAPKKVLPDLKKPTAECAAIDTYKKKQLEAIQSDRKTLEALQSAIAELGLQKQLNFMPGAHQETSGITPVGGSTPVPETAPVATP